jgi:hypothetical protein
MVAIVTVSTLLDGIFSVFEKNKSTYETSTSFLYLKLEIVRLWVVDPS